MQDSHNLQSQLAKEQAALAATNQQIDAAHRQIEALHAQIAATQNQITATERQIEELREHAATIEKRMTLLREYMSMVEAAEKTPGPAPIDAAHPAPAKLASAPPARGAVQAPPAEPAPAPPAPAAVQAPAAPAKPVQPAAAASKSQSEALPSFDDEAVDEIGDLSFVESLPGARPEGTNPPARAKPDSFANLDEQTLTHEVLPRTQTFEEELLLIMAYHRKAIAPKDIARIFRRLDYVPKQKATAANVKAQVDASGPFIEHAKEGRIALTHEGREEAQRLLKLLL